jgi:nitroimidazol reductase NimA-like FMN-containing flavoprotein (pyridoxamine 5'-phosphate oxidase superfamily)
MFTAVGHPGDNAVAEVEPTPEPAVRAAGRLSGQWRAPASPDKNGGRGMNDPQPVTTLSAFSSADSEPTAWERGRGELRDAAVYWLSTVRPDGRPHVTPLLGVWLRGALYFCTGSGERKAKNLVHNPRCAITTGCNTLDDSIDVVVEGTATKVEADDELREVADTYESKYGAHFTEPGGTWFGLADAIRAGSALVYRVAPSTAFGFGKGRQFSQTRWRFTESEVQQ